MISMDNTTMQKIESILDQEVRPHLLADNGGIAVIDLDEDGTLWVEMLGECSDCPAVGSTLCGLVEKVLIKRVPYIKKVELDSGISEEAMIEVHKLLSHKEP